MDRRKYSEEGDIKNIFEIIFHNLNDEAKKFNEIICLTKKIRIQFCINAICILNGLKNGI